MKLKNVFKKNLFHLLLFGFALSLGISLVLVRGRILLISSDSMSPELKTGSLIVVVPRKSYTEGDVITYKLGASATYLVTHRIIAITSTNNINYYITKGDANEFQDSLPVSSSEIIGKIIFSLPNLLVVIYILVGYILGTLLRRIMLLSKNESCRLS